MDKIAFLFPGQGSQYIGMGKEFYEQSRAVQDLFEQASETLGMNLVKLCFEGPQADLIRTDNMQPAITLVNIACLKILEQEGIYPSACAGHSLGEYSALFAAGVIDLPDLLRLVKIRGTLMKEAADRNPGGMIAVMGLGIDASARICDSVRESGHAAIANLNSPKQVIISGERKALERVTAMAGQEGAKFVLPLSVSGPWHSMLMREAANNLEQELLHCRFRKPSIRFASNVTGEYESEPERIKANLVAQMTRPIWWQKSMELLIKDGYSLFVEAGPGKVLKGLMKDIRRDVRVFNVENRKTLDLFSASITPSPQSAEVFSEASDYTSC